MSAVDLCLCREPLAVCPHLGVFALGPGTDEEKLAKKRAFYAVRIPELRAALLELDALATRAEMKRAIELARMGTDFASKLKPGADYLGALAFVAAAIAKVAALAGLD